MRLLETISAINIDNIYDIVLMDPPWSYYGQQDKWGAAAKFYPTMTDEELLDLPVQNILHDRSILFMWVTCPRVDFGVKLIEHWGLSFRGVAFVWVKTKKSDPLVPVGAQGVRPSIVKPTTELVLVASNQAKGRPLKLHSESIPQVVLAPKYEHSRKPEAVQDRIDLMYPDSSKLEMFARRKRENWDVWGFEIDYFEST